MPRKRKIPKQKLWRGRPPTRGDWTRLGKITRKYDGCVFDVYQGPPKLIWIPIKLCAVPSAPSKGNYSLWWTYGDAQEGKARFARNREAGLLFERQRDMYDALQARLMSESLEAQIGLVPSSV
jgi:hypothetical protein